jgi:hypothetical protein
MEKKIYRYGKKDQGLGLRRNQEEPVALQLTDAKWIN